MPRALPVRILLCLIVSGVVLATAAAPRFAQPATASPPTQAPESSPNEYVLGFRTGMSRAEREALVARSGGRLLRHLANGTAALVALPALRPFSAALARYAADGAVRYIEPNRRYRIAATPAALQPDDPRWNDGTLWNLAQIDAPGAWQTTTGSTEVVVGVIDTGIDQTHRDLAANMWTAPAGWAVLSCGPGTHGYNSLGAQPACDPAATADNNGHGTLVAGIIGARGGNAEGVVGVNWRVSLMSLKALDANGLGSDVSIVGAIDYAIAAKQAGANVRILNLSWEQSSPSLTLLAALERARDAGILVVVPAGNGAAAAIDGRDLDQDPNYPVGYGVIPDLLPNLIAVTGAERGDVIGPRLNYGLNSVHLAAPGIGVTSTFLGESYLQFSSTTLAAAHVSGAAALLLSAPGLNDLSAAQLKTRLLYCSDPIAPRWKTATGGRLNVARALNFTDCDLPAYDVTTNAAPPEGGTIARSPEATTYPAGSVVMLTATAAPGYRFVGWELSEDRLITANPLYSTIFQARSATAVFEPQTFLFTLTGTSGGQVTSTPAAGTHAAGTSFALTATPDEGFAFVNWTLDGSEIRDENPLTLTLDRDRSARATFASAPPTVTTYQLDLTASAGGSAAASAPGPYAAGTRLTLTATPEPGFVFAGWTVDGAQGGATNSLSLTMTANRAVRANFVRGYLLHLSRTQGGNLEVKAPSWSDGSPYPAGTLVTLTATTNSDYVFAGWTVDGAFQGWANPLTLTMDGEHSVVANFARRRHFTDLPPGPPPYEAISQLAARLIILGYSNDSFGPNDLVQRAQMAALIARAMGWDQENWGNPFTDDNGIDPNLWRNVGTLAHYDVARGYGDGTFGTLDPVLRVQVVSFITRGMVAQGRWVAATEDDPTLYPNVPASTGHRLDLVTYYRYAGAVPGTIATQPWTEWNAPSTRGWFAEVLWQAIDSYYAVDRVP